MTTPVSFLISIFTFVLCLHFIQTADNYVTLLLDRYNDPGATFTTGKITISQLVPGFENVTAQPKLPVNKVLSVTSSDQHWQVLADKDQGIIGPDGQIIAVSSIVPLAPDGQLVAVLDSGFTFPQVSRDVSDVSCHYCHSNLLLTFPTGHLWSRAWSQLFGGGWSMAGSLHDIS